MGKQMLVFPSVCPTKCRRVAEFRAVAHEMTNYTNLGCETQTGWNGVKKMLTVPAHSVFQYIDVASSPPGFCGDAPAANRSHSSSV